MERPDGPEPPADLTPTDPDTGISSAHPAAGPMPGGPEAELRTFLIADIRGYTAYTTEHGADAAGALAARFAAIIREVVTAHDGFLIELRGDEALAVFLLARKALRAALELQTRFAAELDRGVGIGMDAGEAIPIEGGYRGSALNLAARLCGQAGPGETLASEAVIHLAAKVDGIGYTDPRTYRLKGMDEPIRAVHVVSAEKGSKKPIRYGRDGGIDRRLLAVAGIAIGAIVVAVVGLSGTLGPARPTDSAQPSGATASAELFALDDLPVVVWLDPETGAVKDSRRTDSVIHWARYYESDDSYWVVRSEPWAVVQIDATTHETVKTIPISLPVFGGIDGDARTLYVADQTRPRVVGIDVTTGAQTHDFADLAPTAEGLAPARGLVLAAGSLWVGIPDMDEVLRLDPASGSVQARISGVRWADGLATDGNAVYATGHRYMNRIDTVTNTVTWTADLGETYLIDAVFGGGYIWTVNDEKGTVWKIGQAGEIVDTYQTGVGSLPLAPLGGEMWVGVQDAGKLVAIDMVTGSMRELPVGHQIYGIAASPDELMVTLDQTPEEIVAQVEGDVLTIAAPYQPLWAPDPAQNGSFEFRQAGFLTCAGLLRYPDKPGADGWVLEPEVAAAMPEVSDDGLTYTFTVRDGFQFSPPSNEPLTATTFKASIERALSPDMPGYFIQFLPMIDGVTEYQNRQADHISGIEVDGSVIRFRLSEPAGDFLNRLTMPYYCPVPIGTPAIPDIDPQPPLAAAGPYYLARHVGGELGLFAKNPNYTGDRPQPWDAIAFRVGFEPGEAIGRVESGLADAATSDAAQPLLNAQSELAKLWGPGSDAAASGDQRWFGASRFQTLYFSLDPADPLLGDPDVRRAVSLALDRTRLAATHGMAPWPGVLPPAVPGSLPPDSRVPAPDLEAARTLMAGRTGTLVTQGVEPAGADPRNDALLQELASELSQIGITVQIQRYEDPWEASIDPTLGIDLIFGATDTDHPDPVAQMERLSENARLPAADYLELSRLRPLTGQARYDGAAALARKIVDEEHLVIPFAYPVYPLYLGEHVGCGFVQPAIAAVDLLSLCREG